MLYGFQIHSFIIHSTSAYTTDFISSLIPKVYCKISLLLANGSRNVLEELVDQCCKGWSMDLATRTSDRCFPTNCQPYFVAGLFLIPLFTICHYLLALLLSQNLTPFSGNHPGATKKATPPPPACFVGPSPAAQRADDKKSLWISRKGKCRWCLVLQTPGYKRWSFLQREQLALSM